MRLWVNGFVFIGLLVFNACLAAEQPVPAEPSVWEALTEDRDYQEEADEPDDTEAFDTPDMDGFQLPSWLDMTLVRGLLMLLVGGLVVFLLVRIITAPGNRKLKDAQILIQQIDDWDVDIQELDLDQLLQQALSNGDLRLIIRIRYLLLLQALDAIGWIDHHKDKTNGAYIRELAQRPIVPAFRRLTLQFERVWYGEYPLEAEEFSSTEAAFKTLQLEIQEEDD